VEIVLDIAVCREVCADAEVSRPTISNARRAGTQCFIENLF